jgi:hypothetical protein
MTLQRLLRLRMKLSDAAKAEAARRNCQARTQEERLQECGRLQRTALERGGLAAVELLAQASVSALEARRAALARAELASAAAQQAHREMRQIEIVFSRDAQSRARKRAARAQREADEHAARLRRSKG